ncbi:MAG: hypothetical protein JOZ83_05370 [Silvibacterium sp.]|nr:hypothetical protein [Silvibacterium sp.]
MLKICSWLALFLALGNAAALAQTYADPIPYCRAVGTIDKPDARYTGPKLPAWMAEKLNLKPDQDKFMEWRCADHQVLACLYGANIPCDSKAFTSRKPTQAVVDYCKQNPDSSFVPMYVTGHETSLSWACHGPRPVVIRSESVDAQGYVKAYWKAVSP